MELRDFIAKETGDTDYAYGKGNVVSYTHGQIDMLESSNDGQRGLNVAICNDGEIIRRENMYDIDPLEFVL